MILSLCGTPGTGKTTAAEILGERGHKVEFLRDMIERNDWYSGKEGEDLLIDLDELLDRLSARFDEGDELILDGHLSYLAPFDVCLVLRLHPDILRSRLEARGYSEDKIDDNVVSEAISYLTHEAVARGTGKVLEIDVTGIPPVDVADAIEGIWSKMKDKRLNELDPYGPGRIDWLEVVSEWY